MSARECTIGRTGAVMRMKRDVVDVSDSLLATMASDAWCGSFVRCFSLAVFLLISASIPQDRCRFPTVQTDLARRLLSPLTF